VRVNAVCPGFIDCHDHPEERMRQVVNEIPAGRLGRVDEVADVVSWLIGESPSYVTEAHISVTGAWDY